LPLLCDRHRLLRLCGHSQRLRSRRRWLRL
jgi:hypothetical protein